MTRASPLHGSDLLFSSRKNQGRYNLPGRPASLAHTALPWGGHGKPFLLVRGWSMKEGGREGEKTGGEEGRKGQSEVTGRTQ